MRRAVEQNLNASQGIGEHVVRHLRVEIAGRADPALLDAERAIEALVLSAATQRALDEGRSIEIG